MTTDKCFNCMKTGHKAHQCPREEKDWEIYCYDIDEDMCTRCGRWNHTIERCYEKRDIFGKSIIHKMCYTKTSRGISKTRKTEK